MSLAKNSVILLNGLTQKGKNRIRENGEEWTVVEIRQSVLFTSEPGPWILIESNKTKHIRWIHSTHDKDFSIK